MMKNNALVAIACLLAGGAFGFLLGSGNSSPEAVTDTRAVEVRLGERGVSPATGSSRTEKPTSYREIAARPGQMNRIQAMLDLYSNLSPGGYAAEAENLKSLPFSERILAAYLLFTAWAEVSPVAAMTHANSKMGFAGNFMKPTLLQSWAASDPRAAANYLESNKGELAMMGTMGWGRRGRGSDTGSSVIASEWAKQDPEGALTWAKSLSGKDGKSALTGVITELAKTDPAKASGLVGELDEGDRARAYASIAAEMGKNDWASTESWIGTLPADQRDGAMASAIRSLASSDSTLAAQRALTLPEGEARTEAMEVVVGELAKEDPAEAVSWVMTNGSEEAQRESIGEAMPAWVASDAQSARAWIDSQASGGVRDAAVRSFVSSNQKAAPLENIELAKTITNDRARDRVIGMTGYRWMSEEPEQAREFFEATDAVSDRVKERILNGGGRRRGRPGR